MAYIAVMAWHSALARTPRTAAAIVLAGSAATLGGAFAFQYLGGLAPCELCLIQRWPYAASIAAALLAFAPMHGWAAQRALLGVAGVAFVVGVGLAAWHIGVEQNWIAGPEACSGGPEGAATVEELRRRLMAQDVVRCDEVPWSLFGISLAGFNLLISAALAVFSLSAALPARRGGAA
jgi:disulfide bond formation protein DsbB